MFFGLLRKLPIPCARWTFAIPNGYLDSKSKRIRAWQEGVVAGVSDVFVPYPSPPYAGLFLEFKAAKGRPTDAQVEFLTYANAVGYKAVVVYSYQEAIRELVVYLGPSAFPRAP